jgi:hypothetical protein
VRNKRQVHWCNSDLAPKKKILNKITVYVGTYLRTTMRDTTGNLRNTDVYGVVNNNNVGGNRRKRRKFYAPTLRCTAGFPVFLLHIIIKYWFIVVSKRVNALRFGDGDER